MIRETLISAFPANKAILRQFVGSMSEEEIHRRIRNYWTIYEHIDHLVETQAISLERIGLFLREERPVIVPFVPDGIPDTGKKSVAELLDSFDDYRSRQVELVEKAPARVWERLGSHDQYTKYGFEILLRHTLLHDSFHMARMEQLWIMKEEFLLDLDSN
jgi:hypothetical protein